MGQVRRFSSSIADRRPRVSTGLPYKCKEKPDTECVQTIRVVTIHGEVGILIVSKHRTERRLKSQRSEPQKRPRQKRMSAANRTAMIIESATNLFADQGLTASTRTLADNIGVTQALLYRYFRDKDTLVEAVMKRAFDDEWRSAMRQLQKQFADGGALPAFLAHHETDKLRLKLFMRAVLDGVYFPKEFVRAVGLGEFV
jgi:Bacterial regulatory proteins, tetR family